MSIQLKMSRLAKLATFATFIGGMTLAAASASATPSFTWNPGGSTPGLATQPAFTADNITVKDFANIQIQNGGVNNGHFTETGILQITAFSNGSGVVSTPFVEPVQTFQTFPPPASSEAPYDLAPPPPPKPADMPKTLVHGI